MTHYEKLATMFFRIIGLGGIIYSVYYYISAMFFTPEQFLQYIPYIKITVFYLVLSISMFLASNSLAYFVCIGFRKEDD